MNKQASKIMEKDTSKSTVLIISMGFLFLYLVYDFQPLLYLSLTVGILGLSDKISRLMEKGWMGLAKLMSYIVPNILLTLVFFLILYPIALIFRLTQNDPLFLTSSYDTYWVEDESKFDRKSFEKTW